VTQSVACGRPRRRFLQRVLGARAEAYSGGCLQVGTDPSMRQRNVLHKGVCGVRRRHSPDNQEVVTRI